MSRRIWIDVTDFLKWQGNFTGFQHIQYNMAKHYLASGHDVAFFVYDQDSHCFSQVEFDPDVVSANGIRGAESEVGTLGAPRRSLLATAKRLTPTPLKKALKKAMGRTETQAAPVPHGSDSPFNRGDVVVVLGGIWHGSFASDMTREKKKHGFTFVHVVHDMIPVVTPQYVVEDLPAVFEAYKEKIFKIADGLLYNSESSKKDALAFMKTHGITPPSGVVFRLADEPLPGQIEEPAPGLKPGSFILSLGTVEGRKNQWLLYYAYKQAAREGISLPKLVIAGRHGWLVDDFLYVSSRDPETKDQFVVLDGVPNSQRAWLFHNCLFAVWPSFYEGWGMPVAETLTYGKLCLSSDVSAMPEIGGKLVDYFSPYDSSECLKLIVKYLDAGTRGKKEAKIRKEYKPTSWADMFGVISTFIDKL